MKNISFLFILLFTVLSCKENKINADPNASLTVAEQESFKYSVSRYINRLARKAAHDSKFNHEFDQEYKEMAERNDLLYYYEDEKGGIYFAIAKIAPSLTLKKAATVGRLKIDSQGNITEYEEGFRTWKMPEEELREKTGILFEKYYKGEDLSGYYTENSNGEYYIEFPDRLTTYNKEKRQWHTENLIKD